MSVMGCGIEITIPYLEYLTLSIYKRGREEMKQGKRGEEEREKREERSRETKGE